MPRKLVAFLLLAFSSISAANERAEYMKDLAALKNKNRSAYEANLVYVNLKTKLFLGQIGYPVGQDFSAWDKISEVSLRSYEAQRKIPVTGNPLSFETRQKILDDGKIMNTDYAVLASSHIFLEGWDQWVSANGTWMIKGENTLPAEQATKIECDRQKRHCVEATALLNRAFGSHLSALVEIYEIERWDDHEIVTKPVEYGCVRYMKRINRAQKSVTGIRSRIHNDKKDCKFLDQDEKQLVLGDGFASSVLQQQVQARERRALLSPDARQALEKWERQ